MGQSSDSRLKSASISALVRREDQAVKLRSQNIEPIIFSGLDDTDSLSRLASNHDVVINCAISYNVAAAKAFIEGLSSRKRTNSTTVLLPSPLYIHTSGTSSIAVGTTHLEPNSTPDLPPACNDATEDIYTLLRRLESSQVYPQRATDIAVIDTGEALNIPTYIIMPPLVYGLGSGLFNRRSIQEPAIINKALATKQCTPFLSPGYGAHNHIHASDLSRLYELLLINLLDNITPLPSGKKGIYFAESGSHTWLEISRGLAAAGLALGALETDKVKGVSPEEWVASAGGTGSKTLPNDPEIVAHSMGSHGLTKAVLAREMLGWVPVEGEEGWRRHFREEFADVLASGS